MIGGYIGKAIGEPIESGAHAQAVTASVTFGVSINKSVGKNVAVGVNYSVAIQRAVGKAVTAGVDWAVTVRKAISVTLDAASVTFAVNMTKGIAKSLVAPVTFSAILASFQRIISTLFVNKPVNVALAGNQPIKDRYRTYEIPPFRKTEKVTAKGSSVRRMKGPPPSFTVKTDKRGYD